MRIIKEKLLHLFLKEPNKFSLQVKPLGVSSKRLQFLVIVLPLPKLLSVSHALFSMVQGWECMVQGWECMVQGWECMVPLSDKNHNNTAMKGKFNSLFASLKLNSCCYLSKKKLSDCLCHSVPLDCLNLRLVSSEARSTQYLAPKVVIWNVLIMTMSCLQLCQILTWIPSKGSMLLIQMISLETYIVNVR